MINPEVNIEKSKAQNIQSVQDNAEHFKTILRMRCPVSHELTAALQRVDVAVKWAIRAIEDNGPREENCISEASYNSLKQAVRDWIEQELKLEREDIRSFHIRYDKHPIVVNIQCNDKHDGKKHFALFEVGKNEEWRKV